MNHFKGKKVLVTGGLGFVGRNLIAALLELKANVTIVERTFSEVDPEALKKLASDHHLNLVEADIADRRLVDSYIKGQDYLFHLAGHSGPVGSLEEPFTNLEVNCLGSLNLLDACRRLNSGIKIVFPSSRQVYGKPKSLPVTEDTPTNPLTIYGTHKLAIESYFRIYYQTYGIRSAILRASNPYGPHVPQVSHKYNILNWFIDEADRGRDLIVFGDGEQERDYFYVSDFIQALLLAAVTPEAYGEVFNIGYGRGQKFRNVAKKIRKVVKKGRVVRKAWPENYKAVETGDYVSDISKAKKILGWHPTVKLEEGIAKTISQTKDSKGVLSKLLKL